MPDIEKKIINTLNEPLASVLDGMLKIVEKGSQKSRNTGAKDVNKYGPAYNDT